MANDEQEIKLQRTATAAMEESTAATEESSDKNKQDKVDVPPLSEHPPHGMLVLSGRPLEEQEEKYGSCLTRFERKRGMHNAIYVCMAACVVFVAITSFMPEPIGLLSTNCPCQGNIRQCICPRPTLEALTTFQIFCLANSRISAYVLYPLVRKWMIVITIIS